MGIPNNDDLTKAHSSAQLGLQSQQNVNAKIEEIWCCLERSKNLVAIQLFIISKTFLGLIRSSESYISNEKVSVRLKLHAKSYDRFKWSGQVSQKYALRWLFVLLSAALIDDYFLSLLLV
jgi:hypothetical protein